MTDWPARLRERLLRANELYLDLVETLTPELLRSRIPGVRSSPMANHLWCVVGARESYSAAVRAGSWQGFRCSLDDEAQEDPVLVRAALERTAEEVDRLFDEMGDDDPYGPVRVLKLVEHEAQHHGQLIRYFYALPLRIPLSWRAAYALEEST